MKAVQARISPELRDLMLERQRQIEQAVRIKPSMPDVSRTIVRDIRVLEGIKPIQSIEKIRKKRYKFNYGFKI